MSRAGIIAAGLLTMAVAGDAFSEVATLACSGLVYQHEAEPKQASVNGGASVNLDALLIDTPMGKFKISKVEDTAITFIGRNGNLNIFGSLSRVTGEMSIFWRTAAEEAKLQAGQSSTTSMYAELTCQRSVRLF